MNHHAPGEAGGGGISGFEAFSAFFQVVRIPGIIRVQKSQERGCCEPGTVVACGPGTRIGLRNECQTRITAEGNFGFAAIGGGVVYNNQFKICEGLAEYSVETPVNIAGFVVKRDDNGNARHRGLGVS